MNASYSHRASSFSSQACEVMLFEDAFARDRDTEVIIRRSRKAPASALEKIVDRATAIGLKVSIAMY